MARSIPRERHFKSLNINNKQSNVHIMRMPVKDFQESHNYNFDESTNSNLIKSYKHNFLQEAEYDQALDTYGIGPINEVVSKSLDKVLRQMSKKASKERMNIIEFISRVQLKKAMPTYYSQSVSDLMDGYVLKKVDKELSKLIKQKKISETSNEKEEGLDTTKSINCTQDSSGNQPFPETDSSDDGHTSGESLDDPILSLKSFGEDKKLDFIIELDAKKIATNREKGIFSK